MYRKSKLRELSTEHFNSWYRQYRLWRRWLKVAMIYVVPSGLIIILAFPFNPTLLINIAGADPAVTITLISWILLVGIFAAWGAYIYFILDRILEKKAFQQQQEVDQIILSTAKLGDDGEYVFPDQKRTAQSKNEEM